MNDLRETSVKEAGIYVHIPFCVRRCNYCDFLSTTLGDETQRRYFAKLNEQIAQSEYAARKFSSSDCHIISVFFGGGTPSLPDPELLTGTLKTIRETFSVDEDAEITVECNPGTMDEARLWAFSEAGVNRLSIGLQSADDGMLKKLGRIHTFEMFCREFEAARQAGFQNISVDLMYDLPGQDRAVFLDTLEKVLGLEDPPQHISPYSLIIEEGTPFWERYHEDAERRKLGDQPLFLPSEDEEAGMLADLKEILTEHGYHRYEISNWALDGFESLHNKGYWERREYLGFGPGAASQMGKQRWKNTDSLSDYLAGDLGKKERIGLTYEDEMEETMFLGLREMKGVTRSKFRKLFGVSMDQVYGDVISRLTLLKLLTDDGERVKLTDRGIEISNVVLAEFLLT